MNQPQTPDNEVARPNAPMTITEFCDQHNACREGRTWALSTGLTTVSDLWTHPDLKPEWRMWIFSREGVASERNQRLFAVWCSRQVQHLMTDPRSIAAIDVAERFANGEATREELESACAAARAVWAAGEAARAATLEAVWAAEAAEAAAWAALEATWAAGAAAWAAGEAARAAQANYLTTNFPTWESLKESK
jgi:hypothetical protein